MRDLFKKSFAGVLVTVIGGFVLALLVSECRMIRKTHDEVIRLEQKLDK